MRERTINFNRNDDPTVATFNEKELKDYKKAFGSMIMSLRTLDEHIEKGDLTVGFKATLASCIENYTVDLNKTLGYEGILEKEKQERFKEIRELNTENHALRKQLGEKASMEDVREALKNISDLIKRWWNIEGLGHLSEISFEGWAVKVKLSSMITDAYYAKGGEEGYEGKEDKIRRFIKLGYDFNLKERASEADLLNTENNIKLLTQFIKSRFPSAELDRLDIAYYHKNPTGEIRNIYIRIRNYDDFTIKP